MTCRSACTASSWPRRPMPAVRGATTTSHPAGRWRRPGSAALRCRSPLSLVTRACTVPVVVTAVPWFTRVLQPRHRATRRGLHDRLCVATYDELFVTLRRASIVGRLVGLLELVGHARPPGGPGPARAVGRWTELPCCRLLSLSVVYGRSSVLMARRSSIAAVALGGLLQGQRRGRRPCPGRSCGSRSARSVRAGSGAPARVRRAGGRAEKNRSSPGSGTSWETPT